MYQRTEGNDVIRLSDAAVIPQDPENRDRQAYDFWVSQGNLPQPASGPTEQELYERWKSERAEAVSKIVVTTVSGLVFDGDEISQSRMARAVVVLRGEPEGSVVQWVLANNTVVDVGLDELTQALKLAGLRQTELWVQA